MQLRNKKVLIIGGSSGMGLQIAQCAADEGAQVIIAGRSAKKLRDATAMIANALVETVQCDIGSKEQVEAAFEAVGEIDH